MHASTVATLLDNALFLIIIRLSPLPPIRTAVLRIVSRTAITLEGVPIVLVKPLRPHYQVLSSAKVLTPSGRQAASAVRPWV